MDPRIEADGVTQADLVAQAQICNEVLLLQAQARKTLSEIDAGLKNLESLIQEEGRQEKLAKKLKVQLDEVRAEMVMAKGRYQTPMLIDQIGYLYSMLDRADQKPGRDAYIRLDELKEWLQKCQTECGPALKQIPQSDQN